MSKPEEASAGADDSAKKDSTEQPKEAAEKEQTQEPAEKEQTDAEAIADPTTSVAHLAEIARANNENEKKAAAELERIQ